VWWPVNEPGLKQSRPKDGWTHNEKLEVGFRCEGCFQRTRSQEPHQIKVVFRSEGKTESLMKRKMTYLLAAAGIAFGGLVSIPTPAAARIVCNSYGDCWHVDSRWDYNRYDRGFGARWHPDDWYFHRHWDQDRDYHWRDYHEGRGYYRNGIWLSF
jgi:hypothetical protein